MLLSTALNDSLATFCGYLLNRKEGFSIAVCGFVQTGLAEKITYPNYCQAIFEKGLQDEVADGRNENI